MKKIIIFAILLLNISCINLNFFKKTSFDKLSESEREQKITTMQAELDKKYYEMLENEIKEKDRKSIEDNYKNLKNEIAKIDRKKSSAEHVNFLNKHNKEINLKLQYLIDLQ